MGAKVTAMANYFFPYEIDRIWWEKTLHFCLRPRRCFFSHKLLWFKKCYTGTMFVRYADDLLTTTVYVEKHQFLIHVLSK
jgi:hypothetical protein